MNTQGMYFLATSFLAFAAAMIFRDGFSISGLLFLIAAVLFLYAGAREGSKKGNNKENEKDADK